MYGSLATSPEQPTNNLSYSKEAPGSEARNKGAVKLIQKIASAQIYHDNTEMNQTSAQKDNYLSKTPLIQPPKQAELRRNIKR